MANNSQQCCVLFARELYTYRLLDRPIKFANSCTQFRARMNVCRHDQRILQSRRFNMNILIFLVSMKSPFKLLDLPIKRSRKEEILQGRVCTNVRATQNFLGSFSWSKGKTTSRRRNETGTRIYGSGFGFFHSVRCPFRWIRVTQAGFGDEIHTFCYK